MNASDPSAKVSSPLRVALVHYRDDVVLGGSLRVGEILARHLDPRRVEAHLVFAYGGPGPVARSARVPCHFLAASGPADVFAWLRTRLLFRRLQPAVVHFVDPIVWVHFALLGTSPVKLLHVHGRYLPSYMNWRGRTLRRLLGKLADGQVCINHGAQKSLVELGWARPARTWVVPNAVDCRYFSELPPKLAARAHLKLPLNARVLGMVCRLVRHRGCQQAIQLLHRLPQTWHLLLCGDGPFRSDLAAQATAGGLGNRVRFTGQQEDVRPAYAAMDAFLMLARYEAFGLAMCEAMAAGVPVFGLAGGGEYREPEYPLVTAENAVFVERPQPIDYAYRLSEESAVLEELARLLADFGQNPGKYRAMTDEARRWVVERFDAPLHAERMTTLYEALCTARQPDIVLTVVPRLAAEVNSPTPRRPN